MIKRLKENEKGLTLIELLVVIVILGIIAAIAIIAIGGIIDNSKKDAHIANAKQLANAAKLYAAAADVSEGTVTLNTLIEQGYTDDIKDPSVKDKNYDTTNTTVQIKRKGAAGFEYIVKLVADGKTKNYINKTDKNAFDLTRDDIDVDANK